MQCSAYVYLLAWISSLRSQIQQGSERRMVTAPRKAGSLQTAWIPLTSLEPFGLLYAERYMCHEQSYTRPCAAVTSYLMPPHCTVSTAAVRQPEVWSVRLS